MTAVVGPNGCGKSNVIDAVRWVLGESSAKNLRGESMTDVIFNGSNTRKPISQASIELVFDNSDASLLGEYAAYGEISVKRKVTRDGQSLYFLNGTKCRRRDITDLFLGTGLGPRSYAIIEQGMISRLVEARPDDLRIFIEEAAGISKYKERRRETENRMRRTQDNLARLTDLREELGRQLERLQRQAHAAERYSEFKQQEKQFKAELTAIRWRDLAGSSDQFEQTLSRQQTALEALVAEQCKADTAIEHIRDANHELNEHFNQVQASYYAVAAEIARIEQTIQHSQQRTQQLQTELRESERLREEAQLHLQQDQENLARVEQQLHNLEPEYELLAAANEQDAEQLLQAQDAFECTQQDWEQLAQQNQVPMRQIEVQKARISQLDDSLQRLQHRQQKMQAEQQASEPYDFQQALEKNQQEQCVLTETLSQQQAITQALQSQLQEQRQQLQQLQQDKQQSVAQLQEIEGECIKLQALQQAALSVDEEATDWLLEHGLEQLPRVLEQLQVQPKWQQAVELVLSDRLRARVIELKAVPKHLPETGRLSLQFMRESSNNVVASTLQTQVQSVLDLSAVLGNVFLAETLEQAWQLHPKLTVGQSLITPEGIWLSYDGLTVQAAQVDQGSALARVERINQLLTRTQQLTEQIAKLAEQTQQAQLHLIALEQQLEGSRQQQQSYTTELAQVQSALAIVRNQQEQHLLREQQQQIDLAEIAENIAIEQENKAQAQALLEEALEQSAVFAEQSYQLQEARDNARERLEQVRLQMQHSQQKAHQLDVQIKSLWVEEKSIKQALDRLEQQYARALARHDQLALDLTSGESPLEELKAKLEEQLSLRLERDEQLRAARVQLEEADNQIREQERIRHQAEQQAQVLRNQIEKQRLDLHTVEVRRKTLQEQLTAEGYHLDSVLLLLAAEASEAAWQTQLEQVQERITRLGAINLAAIEEYKQQSERKTYLDEQDADLNEALATLENVIRKIDRETRNRFKETFDKINDGLQSLFPKVFGGGQAYLELTGEDLLDTGVAIMARPPGKKNSTIHLLSGGEKALTALALVFSIFQLNPAPFCMLDEVDAPLDDANVGRYARLVKEMSTSVQFIYITHNKIAMEMADQLLGVTMHEPGCSRLVAVNIEEAAAMAES